LAQRDAIGTFPSARAKWRFNHYTTWEKAAKIGSSKSILGNPVWVTPDWYFSGATAKERLALPDPQPPEMFFRVPESDLRNLTHVGPVVAKPDNDGRPQAGGGDEWTADGPVSIVRAVEFPIGP
jgi:hypothetical protein